MERFGIRPIAPRRPANGKIARAIGAAGLPNNQAKRAGFIAKGAKLHL